MNGWTGNILRIELGSNEVSCIPTLDYAEKYIGGRGIGTQLYWELSNPKARAFDPENPLIFMVGPLVGTGIRAANIMSVVGKSPSSFPDFFSYANISGHAAAELKRAGFDGIIVLGKAERPVYLWIKNNNAEILDGSHIWGKKAYATVKLLQHDHGEKIRFITTGVAGENKVRNAIALASHEATLSRGFGAVMGSKNLKAIVIKGNGKITAADPSALKNLNHHIDEIDERIHFPFPPDIIEYAQKGVIEIVGKGGCYACSSKKCIRNVYRYDKRLEGIRHCESMEYYIPSHYGIENEPIDTIFHAPAMANDYSIDTYELQKIVDWLFECNKAGILNEKDTGLPLSKIGSRSFLEKLLHSISNREGFGDILAEGLQRACDKISPEAEKLLETILVPIGEYGFNPLFISQCLMHSMETRLYQSWYYDQGFPFYAWFFNQNQIDNSPVTTEVFKKIAKDFWGGEEAGDLSGYKGKARAAVLMQDRAMVKDSLGLCSYTWPINYSYATEDNLGDPDLESRLLSAVSGRDVNNINEYGSAIYDLQRMILIREGRKVPEDDYPPERLFTTPIQANPKSPVTMVPGPDNKVVNMEGRKLDKKQYLKLLREYYNLRGWDTETGVPLSETLKAEGLGDIIHIS